MSFTFSLNRIFLTPAVVNNNGQSSGSRVDFPADSFFLRSKHKMCSAYPATWPNAWQWHSCDIFSMLLFLLRSLLMSPLSLLDSSFHSCSGSVVCISHLTERQFFGSEKSPHISIDWSCLVAVFMITTSPSHLLIYGVTKDVYSSRLLSWMAASLNIVTVCFCRLVL